MYIANPNNLRRFVLCGNIKRFVEHLNSKNSVDSFDYFRGLVNQNRRELALLDAQQYGAFNALRYRSRSVRECNSLTPEDLAIDYIDRDSAILILSPGPGLKIVYANEAISAETGIAAIQMVGRPVYEVFPENPDAFECECIAGTLLSINKVMETKKSDILPAQRYDIRNPDGVFMERYWRIEFRPLFDAKSEVAFIKVNISYVTPAVEF